MATTQEKSNSQEENSIIPYDHCQPRHFSPRIFSDDLLDEAPESKTPVITRQRIRENFMMGLTSIVTKFYGRWAQLSLISYASFSSYLLSNFFYTIPEIAILGTIARGVFESCSLIHKARIEEGMSIIRAISLLSYRKAKQQDEIGFIHKIHTKVLVKEKVQQCIKSGAKLATVYTVWSIATYALKAALALTAMTACWQAVIVIVSAAIITGVALAAINYCIDKRENCVQDGALQGTSEGAAWSALEGAELHKATAIGLWGDCPIVAAGVSLIYGASGAVSNWNKRIKFLESDVTSRFVNWDRNKLNEKSIKTELKVLLNEKGYNTTWHWLTGSYSYALRTAIKTVKLHFLEQYSNNSSPENKHKAEVTSKIHRHPFTFKNTNSLTLFNKIKSGKEPRKYKTKLQENLKQHSLNYIKC